MPLPIYRSKMELQYRYTKDELSHINDVLTASYKSGLLFHQVDGSTDLSVKQQRYLLSCVRQLSSMDYVRSATEDIKFFTQKEFRRLGLAYRAICMVERIRLLLSSQGIRQKRVYSYQTATSHAKAILQWYTLYCTGKAEKIAKFQSVSCFNMLFKTEPLESIDLPFGWPVGYLGLPRQWASFKKFHFQFSRGARSIEEALRYGQCYLYFKVNTPVVSKEFVEEALQKHKSVLTTEPHPLDETYANNAPVLKAALKQRVRKIVRRVFASYRDPVRLWDPSTSSSCDKFRSRGGQLSEIDFKAKGWKWDLTRRGWQYGCNDPEYYDYHDTGYEFIKVPRFVEVHCNSTSKISARPVGLCEPLKCRVITAETTWSTYFLKGAQKSLWECLHKFPWFTLTGRPIIPSQDIPRVEPGLRWISVDYSAATDNLNCHFTKIVTKEICDLTGLPYELCYESLCEHALQYKEGTQVREYAQKNGQLMGSILSFIVLCICNATILSLSTDPMSIDWDRRILVNGDDGLFLGDEEVYERWRSLSSYVGLAPSVGKVYFSDKFCVINSQAFYLNKEGVVSECLYPRASGMSMLDARTSSGIARVEDLSDKYKKWMEGWPEDSLRRVEAEKLWFRHFEIMLGEIADKSVSWHLPKCLGGLELPLPIDGSKDFDTINFIQFLRARKLIKRGLRARGVEGNTYVKVYSDLETTEDQMKALRKLGLPDRVIFREEPQNRVCTLDKYIEERHAKISGSILVKSLLECKKPEQAFEELTVDPSSNLIWVKPKSVGKYQVEEWKIPIAFLQSIRVEFGSKKLNEWWPKLSLTKNYSDRIISPYNRLLKAVIAERR